jgi:hypothetical protein
LATLLPFVEEALLAQLLGMKSSSSSSKCDDAGHFPLQAAPLGLDEPTSLLFDDAPFLALVFGMKIKILVPLTTPLKYIYTQLQYHHFR